MDILTNPRMTSHFIGRHLPNVYIISIVGLDMSAEACVCVCVCVKKRGGCITKTLYSVHTEKPAFATYISHRSYNCKRN